MYNVAIKRGIAELTKTVREYESDTFSASDMGLTEAEVETIVTTLIVGAIDDMVELTTLDGYMLAEELDEVRDNV